MNAEIFNESLSLLLLVLLPGFLSTLFYFYSYAIRENSRDHRTVAAATHVHNMMEELRKKTFMHSS